MADDRSRRPPWLTQTRVVFALLVVLVIAALLLTPTVGDERGRLTTHSAAPGGARGLSEALSRLGWRVERRTTPYTEAADSAAVHAVLDPAVTLSAGEAHRLLEAVRAGAGLLFVVQPNSALADSLDVARSELGAPMPTAPEGLCPDSLNRQGLIRWGDGLVHSWWLVRYPQDGATSFSFVQPTHPMLEAEAERMARDSVVASRLPTRAMTSGPLELDANMRPAMVGFTLGRGRVVAVADPDLLRNDVIRVCAWNAGLTAVRAMEWLGAAGGRRVIFDEYHHGYGTHANPTRAIRRALTHTAPGRAVLVLVAASLVLLAAAAVRPVAPRGVTVVERRSPLEHVDALARAYSRVGATRLAARRLVRGLRRRHATGAARRGGDDEWLRAVAARHPDVADDAARLERALAGQPSGRHADRELAAVGEAVANLDQRLRPDR